MKENYLKIEEKFKEYGFLIELEAIQRAIKKAMDKAMNYSYKGETEKDKRETFQLQKKLFIKMGEENLLKREDELNCAIGDFSQFHKKMNLNKEWEGLPEWITDSFYLIFSYSQDGYRIMPLKNKIFGIDSSFYIENEGEYFEEAMETSKREEYLLKKIFNKEESKKIIRECIKEKVNSLEEEVEQTGELLKLGDEVKVLLEECFETFEKMQTEIV